MLSAEDVTNLFLNGVKTLNVPRLEDLPYWTSPPVQFVYESTAPLALGAYTWNDAPSALTPNRPIVDNALYFFRSISLAADTSELDFTANIVTTPQFFTFLRGDAEAPLFREPILMCKFFDQFNYRFVWARGKGSDTLLAAFRGIVVQGPAFVGKLSITLKAIISAQEIVDEHFVKLFTTQPYPTIG